MKPGTELSSMMKGATSRTKVQGSERHWWRSGDRMYCPCGYQKDRRISLFQGREERHEEPESCKARSTRNVERNER